MALHRRLAVVCFLWLTSIALAQEKPPQIALDRIVKALDHPLDLTSDGTDRLFIIEQPGRVRLLVDGVVQKKPFLDISDHVAYGGECGLLGIAFHPAFAKNGYFYLDYTTRETNANHGQLMTYISEFHVEQSADHCDPASERIILKINQPFANHNGGQIRFGPDGYVYIGMGDGGSANDPHNNAQNPQSLLGKMLRIDVNQRDTKEGYAIPKDNPFVGKEGWRPEIYALGLRNPWRFSWDRKTGEMYCGDVGQNKYEEVDIITKGGNYGWRLREGFHKFQPEANEPKLIDPIKEYDHAAGISITGGYVYRGAKFKDLQGWYIYADYGKGRIWGLKYQDKKVTADVLLMEEPRLQISSFGEDKDGEIYVCDHGGGGIYHLVLKE
ncbi:MAG TPA: PQQ-dependent sugar dehydrogenase [Tepidisphaeraceae bacterium]|jgi:glucose/arabinose dehydrogenase